MPTQTAFFPSLEEVATKYLVVGTRQPTAIEAAQFPARMIEQQQTLFEQLLLFDKLAIKIRNENVPLMLLLRFFGEKGLEELIEQGALKFIQWKTTVLHMVTDIPGVDAIASGNLNSPAYDDPEQSIELAFKWMKEPPSKRTRKMLKKKVAPLYENPPAELAANVVAFAKSAYRSGKLGNLGLPPDAPLDRLPLPKRELLGKCAGDLSEYTFMLDNGMTSLSSYPFYSLFASSAVKLRQRPDVSSQFSELAKLENVPDLKALYPLLADPLAQLPKLRAKRSSQKFRQWLAETTDGGGELAKEYVSSIANARGHLDTTGGKFLKAIAMTAIAGAAGAGVGAVADMVLAGTAAGVVAGKVADPVVDVGLDLLDEFVLDGLLKGWTPRMFFDDLKELERRDLRDPVL